MAEELETKEVGKQKKYEGKKCGLFKFDFDRLKIMYHPKLRGNFECSNKRKIDIINQKKIRKKRRNAE